MLKPGLDARLRFLDSSARLMNEHSPATSAYLLHERNVVAQKHEKALTKAQLKDICKACGTILIPGVTSKEEFSDHAAKRKRKNSEVIAPQSEPPEKHSLIKCLACHRVTVAPAAAPQRQGPAKAASSTGLISQSHDAMAKSEPQSDIAKIRTEKPASANASSKKRAKARKHGGLQALLEKSKGAGSQLGGSGLDLMDFMKKT
ncbi:MAG: hypothetical protein Q9184_002327 [Pyrenodesmia sp. 2 TL-2023]